MIMGFTLQHRIVALAAALLACAVQAETNNPATDWFCKAGYGVFVHYLNEIQNSSHTIQSLGRSTSWDDCVREFDVERFASAMADAGAGYVIFTTHQRTRFLIAPNATFDRLTGYKPGEACATRDLVEDLYQALHKRNIPLMLYWTGNGPSSDAKANAAMGWQTPVSKEWLLKWAAITEEYALRYGDKVAGWWVDGCYFKHGNLQYDEEKLGLLARALKAGNPKRIIGLNPGVELTAYSRHEDFTAGEQNRFHAQPTGRWLDGEQWHTLSYLGADRPGNYLSAGWCEPGVRYPKQELAEYVYAVNHAGGVVSIDVLLYRDGGLDRSQLEVLKALRPALAGMKSQPPVPPGNLAFRKPTLLLSLDGSRELPVNGGSGGNHGARFGVDGDPGTTALASNEWPWTYEADLLQPFNVRRVKVTCAPDGYATQLRIQVSADRTSWRTVASAENLAGQPFEATFEPASARYLRVSALKPDGPDQPGAQMAVSELEVYE
jgi:hypothetical protein